jgi:hypothetical protein
MPVPVPAKFVGGYLETYYQTLPRELPASYGLLFSAFVYVDQSGRAAMTNFQANKASYIADIKARNAKGQPTILSVGGMGGAKCGLAPGAEASNFVNSVVPIIDEYGFSGIDWDLEEGIPGGINADGLVWISRELRKRYGKDFAITLAPFGNPDIVRAYKAVAKALGPEVTFVGFQYYNLQTPPTSARVLATMEEWMRDCGLRADQWSIGFLHVDDWLKLTTSFDTMASIYRDVNAKHPGVRGVWTWGITEKDKPLGYRFASSMEAAVKPGSPVAPQPVTPTPAPTPAPTGPQVRIGTASHALAGTDVARQTNMLVKYTPRTGVSTKTNQYGAEVVVMGDGVVAAIVDRSRLNSTAGTGIPRSGYVLSGHGSARDWLLQHARIGMTVS